MVPRHPDVTPNEFLAVDIPAGRITEVEPGWQIA